MTGYKLLMDDGYNGNFAVIYDGTGYPNTFSFIATNLITGLPYRFKVIAVNVNGDSQDGDSVTYYSCLNPRNVQTPYKISTTKTTITIGWHEPDNNGCPILGFELYRDTGSSDALSIKIDPASIDLKPSMRQYTIGPLAPLSATFRIKLRALNMNGYTDSIPLSVVLSAIPDTPLTGPTRDVAESDNTKIKMNYGPQLASENGGSDILSYELQIDNGKGGEFRSLIGYD